MKQRLILKNILVGLISLVCLYSCKEDEHYDIYGDQGVIYINEVKGHENFLATGYVLNTPKSSKGDVTIKFPARSTMPVKDDVKVSFEISNELVGVYNEKHNTNYKELDLDYLVVSNLETCIKQGELESRDSVLIYMPQEKYSEISVGDYMIPVRITSVEGDIPLTSSVDKTVYYLIFNVLYNANNIRPAGSEGNEGERLTDRSEWSLSYNGDYSYGPLDKLLDGSVFSYSGGIWTENDYLMVDLGKVHNRILGVYLHYYSSTYEWASIKISTSVDNEEWIEQGNTTIKVPYEGELKDEGIAKFIDPVEARYIKVEAKGGLLYATLWFLTEVNIYE